MKNNLIKFFIAVMATLHAHGQLTQQIHWTGPNVGDHPFVADQAKFVVNIVMAPNMPSGTYYIDDNPSTSGGWVSFSWNGNAAGGTLTAQFSAEQLSAINVGSTWYPFGNNVYAGNVNRGDGVNITHGGWSSVLSMNRVDVVGGSAKTTAQNTHTETLYIGSTGPTKSPQAYSRTLTNSGTQTMIFRLVKPDGSFAVSGYVATSLSANVTWTPGANDPDGVYRLQAYTWTGTDVNAIPVGAWLSTLSTVSNDPTYSRVWSPNGGSLSGNSSASPSDGAGGIQNLSGSSITAQWKDANGNNVGSSFTILNGASQSLDTSGLPSPSAGSSVTYKLVDGSGNVLNTVELYNPGDGSGIVSRNGGFTVVNPTATNPTPTTTQTNTGNVTTGTSSTNPNVPPSISTRVNNGGTTISGNSTGATVQDIYGAFRAALSDSGRSSAAGASPNLSDGDFPDPTSDLDAAVESVSNSRDSVLSTLQTKVGGNPLSSLPTSFGSGPSSINLWSIAGTTASINLNSAGANQIFGTMRACASFVLAVTFAIAVVFTIRRYV